MGGNIRSPLVYVAPVTSTNNGHPFHMPVTENEHCPVSGFAWCEALRPLDLDARAAEGKCEVVSFISDGELSRILGCILAILGQNG